MNRALSLFAVFVILSAMFSTAARNLYATDEKEKRVDPWHLFEPFWNCATVYGESVLFMHDDPQARPNARLLFKPAKILKVASADGSLTFEEGKDYVFNATSQRLELPQGSRILFFEPHYMFPPLVPMSEDHPDAWLAKVGLARFAPDRKSDDSNRANLYGGEHLFHDYQVEITYDRADEWNGYRPTVAKQALSHTIKKLQLGEPITIVFDGDSITHGANASGNCHVAPGQPAYPSLVVEGIESRFGSKVTSLNLSAGGAGVGDALRDLEKLLAPTPDLLVIAYGMNHVGNRNPEEFRTLLTSLIEKVQAAAPNTEILLVAPMYGNNDWSRTPHEQFPLHRDVLASFVGPKIAMADLTALWEQILKRKRYIDTSGNGLNHPNDFGHRLYAQVILGMLGAECPIHK